LTDSILGAP